MAKVKKYSSGGYEDTDDAKNLELAADREAVEYEGEKIAKPLREAAKSEPLKMASFSEAFKEARARGDKTFEYMGKKYTTELASEKKPEVAKKSPTSAAMADGTFAERQTYKRAMQARQKDERRKAMGFKKGGSVSSASKRADGCAIRGKTKGRIV